MDQPHRHAPGPASARRDFRLPAVHVAGSRLSERMAIVAVAVPGLWLASTIARRFPARLLQTRRAARQEGCRIAFLRPFREAYSL
jgi:hypothetical protein